MSDRTPGTPTFNTWDSYLYPETIGAGGRGVLRNLKGIRDAGELRDFEYQETHARSLEIATGRIEIAHTYDDDHLSAIHRHLFGRVFAWAGEHRTVGIRNDPTDFAKPEQIDRYLDDANKIILDTDWAGLDRRGFAERTADVYAYINQAHPHRDGNGRAGKIFMQHVAELSNFRISYDPDRSGITPELWNQQSMLASPDRDTYAPQPESLRPVFYRLAVDAPEGPSANLNVARAARVRSVSGTQSMSDILANAHTKKSAAPQERTRSAGTTDITNRRGRGR